MRVAFFGDHVRDKVVDVRTCRKLIGRLGVIGALAFASSCSGTSSLPPLGEVVVVIDTDVPSPRIVDHLRVDVYSSDGTAWLASRDLLRASWPVSFSVHTTDVAHGRDAIVRLRAYGGAYIQDYLGERFIERPAPVGGDARFGPAPAAVAPFECSNCLRLYSSGVDVTPPTVPIAALAVDRLVLVHIEPGVVRAARVMLRGSCLGSGADLSGLRTCVDAEATLVPLKPEPLVDDVSLPSTSNQGSFEAPFRVPCAGQPRAESGLHDAEVCVPGGLFVLGARNIVTGTDTDPYPERMAAVPSFYIDKYELSVARFRDALNHGFKGPGFPINNNGPANDPSIPNLITTCTMSAVPMGREDAPLNCVSPQLALALCRFYGGDLPTEAQWEYAATVAGRDAKALYPPLAPDGFADCHGVAIARAANADSSLGFCTAAAGYATAPVTFGEGKPLGDETFGIVGMSANVSEFTKDAFASFASICWASAPLRSTSCVVESDVDSMTLRGSNWLETLSTSSYVLRDSITPDDRTATGGFRCVRSAAP